MVVDAATLTQNDGFGSHEEGHLLSPLQFMDYMQPTKLITEYDMKAQRRVEKGMSRDFNLAQ